MVSQTTGPASPIGEHDEGKLGYPPEDTKNGFRDLGASDYLFGSCDVQYVGRLHRMQPVSAAPGHTWYHTRII